jgi:hypothetical protein
MIASKCGVSKSDCRVALFLARCAIGTGVRSLTSTHVVNVLRELEVLLNGMYPNSVAARGRYKSGADSLTLAGPHPLNNTQNYIVDATTFLGHFGIWVHDTCTCVFDWWVSTCTEMRGLHAMGDVRNCDYSSYHIGKRSKGAQMAALATGGATYTVLRQFVRAWIEAHPNRHWTQLAEKRTWVECQVELPDKFIFSVDTLVRALRCTLDQAETDFETMNAIWEWIAPLGQHEVQVPWRNHNAWTKLPLPPIQWHRCDFDEQDTFLHRLQEEFILTHRLSMNHQHDVGLLQRAGYPERPICAATDGGHIPSEHERGGVGKTSAALCIFEALNASAEDGATWEDYKPHPLLVRVKVLPELMGDALMDNDTGELEALTLMMMALPTDAASFTVIDSTAARGNFFAPPRPDIRLPTPHDKTCDSGNIQGHHMPAGHGNHKTNGPGCTQ